MSKKIIVVGSSNTDMVIKAPNFPLPGETILGGKFFMGQGGKGANQAVQAARLGGLVTFITKVGNDIFGQQAIDNFRQEDINNEFVMIDSENATGIALINIDDKGENCISVAPGSNGTLGPIDIELAFESADTNSLVLMQLEIPLATVEYVIRKSYERGINIILNPAPAQLLSPEVYPMLYAITPNEREAQILSGIRVSDIPSAKEAAKVLYSFGVPNVIITLGSKGAYLHTETVSKIIPGYNVATIDSTAAGDCFNGALAVAIAENQTMEDAVAFACKVAAISVTRMGAQDSLPYRNELESLWLKSFVD